LDPWNEPETITLLEAVTFLGLLLILSSLLKYPLIVPEAGFFGILLTGLLSIRPFPFPSPVLTGACMGAFTGTIE
jgi:hypothetical protein